MDNYVKGEVKEMDWASPFPTSLVGPEVRCMKVRAGTKIQNITSTVHKLFEVIAPFLTHLDFLIAFSFNGVNSCSCAVWNKSSPFSTIKKDTNVTELLYAEC